jgi:hypothetical protein
VRDPAHDETAKRTRMATVKVTVMSVRFFIIGSPKGIYGSSESGKSLPEPKRILVTVLISNSHATA